MIVRWPGRVPAGKVENGLISGLDWFPTLVTAAGDPNVAGELLKGKPMGDRSYRVHLDGYDQTALLTGQGPSARKEIFYFAESTLGAVRIGDYKFRFIDQPSGWLGGTTKVDMPMITNLRLDPLERTGLPTPNGGSLMYTNWFELQFWRFVDVQQIVGEYAKTLIDYPPMQRGASFNLESVKAQVEKAIAGHAGR
jgi:arylsulfatase